MKSTTTKTVDTIDAAKKEFASAAAEGCTHFETAIQADGRYHVSVTTDDGVAESKSTPKKKPAKSKGK